MGDDPEVGRSRAGVAHDRVERARIDEHVRAGLAQQRGVLREAYVVADAQPDAAPRRIEDGQRGELRVSDSRKAILPGM